MKKKCFDCDGFGQLVIVEGFHSETSMCYTCGGSGELTENPLDRVIKLTEAQKEDLKLIILNQIPSLKG